MDLKTLKETPPWDWPRSAGKLFLEILADSQADASDRILAAELAGDFTVINDELVEALLSVLVDDGESEELRGTAAISLGPILDHADTDGFHDPDDIPISEDTFRNIQHRPAGSTWTMLCPKRCVGGYWRHRYALHRTGIKRLSGQPTPVMMRIGS